MKGAAWLQRLSDAVCDGGTRAEVAAVLEVSQRTLMRWCRIAGIEPPAGRERGGKRVGAGKRKESVSKGESIGTGRRLTGMSSRKGQKYVRTSDGFMFVVVRGSDIGAHMQCVDAARIFGFFDASAIARDFVKVSQ